jgi:hypothetical protein
VLRELLALESVVVALLLDAGEALSVVAPDVAPDVVPEAAPEEVPLELVPLMPLMPVPALSLAPEGVAPELGVPLVPLVALGVAVLVPRLGLVLEVPDVLALPSVDEPAPVPELLPEDCACESPTAASRDAAAAATASFFESWFMV